ncbi:MAG: nonstructural protein [Arizlama microvirus]|nr:MAG: nonstructural protein [Arizlama microvirus]
MQTINVFAIFDKKAVSYLQPFYFPQKGQAIRAFEDSVNDNQSPFSKHPEDYALYKLGSYDDQTGVITSKQPEFIEEALNLKKT